MKRLQDMSEQEIMADPLLRYAAAMGTGISLNELESECRARGFAPLAERFPLVHNGKPVFWTNYRELAEAFPVLVNSFNFQPTKSIWGGLFRTKDVDSPLLSVKAQLAEIYRQIDNDAWPSEKE